MPRGTPLSGISGQLGIKRRDDPLAYSRAWNAANREKVNAYHRDYHQRVIKADPIKLEAKLRSGRFARRKAKYGLSKAEFLDRLTQQEGKCMICGEYRGEDLRVDHNHSTGEIRDLLCNQCNAGLGQFKEDPTRMAKAIDYLNRHNKGG